MKSDTAISLTAPSRDPRYDPVDVDALYRSVAQRLEQIVRADVRAPDTVIEDACQFAWSRLVHHAHRVRRECALAWLAQTARREAVKLVRRDGRDISLDAALEVGVPMARAAPGPEPEEVCEQRRRLALVARLPERQQRVLWLHALGLSYAEIALETGYSLRTVERQLLRAKRSVRLLEAA
jgi:RNA polymerase sigma factor (sigma-70 family)